MQSGTILTAHPRCMKAVRYMFAHPGKSRAVFLKITGVARLCGAEHRWQAAHESSNQLHEIGLAMFLQVVRACIESKASLESSKKLLVMLEDPATFAMLTLELAAVVENGRVLCSATTNMEADGTAVLSAHLIFETCGLPF